MKLGTRSSYGRSRRGCNTCKYVVSCPGKAKLTRNRIRHVKCDEEKPSCLRCTSTGRKCDGYDHSEFARLDQFCSLHLPGSRKERRAFDYFRSCTVPALCGYFAEEFWEYNVLQASFSQPALRHAAIALGSYHEALSVNPTAQGNIFALRQYAKAISQLRSSIARDREQSLMALMSCVVFVCFDSLTGQFDSAITHLHSGLAILQNCSSLDALFYRIFVRLGLQAMFFVDTRTLNTTRRGERVHMWRLCSDQQNLPADFTSLKQARDELTDIFDGEMHYFYGDLKHPDLEPPEEAQTWGEIERLPGPDSGQAEQVMKLQSWAKAFDIFFKRESLNLTGRDLRGATLLKIHHYVAMNLLHAKLAWMTPVVFIDNYRRIVSLCQSLVKAELSGYRVDFSSDLGIVPVLYYVALNCRVIEIRLQALEMLEATPRREGMWDSRVLSLIIRRAMALEEMASLPYQRWETNPPHRGRSALSALDAVKASVGNWLIYSRTPREAMEEIKVELQNRAGGGV